jgi:hypothetical protein
MGSIDAQNGKPKFIVRAFYLGKLPVPVGINSGVQDLINIVLQLNAPLDELKMDMQEVTISEGKMRLLFVTRGGK